MKFGQSIECNMITILLEKSFIKYGGETIPISFSKTPKLSISLDQSSKISYSLFLLYVKMRAVEIY